MQCQTCLEKFVNKLQTNDTAILEYLRSKGAFSPQFSICKKTIQNELQLSIHHGATALGRLEVLDMIGFVRGSKPTKYYVASQGLKALEIIEDNIKKIEMECSK